MNKQLIITVVLIALAALGWQTITNKLPSTVNSNQDLRRLLVGEIHWYGGYRFTGLFVNDTIYTFQDYQMKNVLIDNAGSTIMTPIWAAMWEKIGQNSTIPAFQKDAYLIKIQAEQPQPIYLINPNRRNKWIMNNQSNIYHYGFDERKIMLGNRDHVDQFPTIAYF